MLYNIKYTNLYSIYEIVDSVVNSKYTFLEDEAFIVALEGALIPVSSSWLKPPDYTYVI